MQERWCHLHMLVPNTSKHFWHHPYFEFSNLKRRRVKIKQEYKANGAGLGSAVWDGSFVLSEYMQREVDVSKKCIVEIGCGLGLVSIVLGMSGEENYIAVDR